MKFTPTHEWVQVVDNVATVGVTDHAQKELGEIVFVELPKLGKNVKAGEEAAVLESTKAAADVYSPVSGEIVAINTALNNASELVNKSPEYQGWLFKVKLSNPQEVDQLLDQKGYLAQIS